MRELNHIDLDPEYLDHLISPEATKVVHEVEKAEDGLYESEDHVEGEYSLQSGH